MATGWFSYQGEFWDPWLRLNPPQAVRTLHPFPASGGQAIWHQYQAYFGMTAIKKSSTERDEGTVAHPQLHGRAFRQPGSRCCSSTA